MIKTNTGTWLCDWCDEEFRRGDGTHCPDCGDCGQTRGHMECGYPA